MFFFYTYEYQKIILYILFALFLAGILLYLSIKLSIVNPDTEKTSTYECGFEPYGDARNEFDVHFYIVAILFIVFDLETIYFFPWCISFSFIPVQGILGMVDFAIELIIGYIYVWKIGALYWGP